MVGKRIAAVGDMVCDILCSPISHLEDSDMQIELDGMNLSPGGNTLNFALAASAFGGGVSFYGARGEDPFGSLLCRWMEDLGVKDYTRKMKPHQTSTTIAIPTLSGERRLLTFPGANAHFTVSPEKVDLDPAGHVHSGGFWFTRKMAEGGTLALFKECREREIITSLDPASPPFGFRGRMADRFHEVIPFVDMLFVNTDELVKITGSRDITKGAQRIIKKGVGTIIVHRAERGTAIISEKGRKDFRAYHVLVPRNPTGCGDVFNGCFVAAVMEGRPLEEAAEMGMAAASLHLASSEPLYPERDLVMERVRRGK